MSKDDLNIGDLAARPKDIDAATADKIMGGQLTNPGTQGGTAPVPTGPYPSSGPASSPTTLGTAGTATVNKGH